MFPHIEIYSLHPCRVLLAECGTLRTVVWKDEFADCSSVGGRRSSVGRFIGGGGLQGWEVDGALKFEDRESGGGLKELGQCV